MQLTSSPRRALGLVAVGAIGMSTAVLGVTGTASAATDTWTFSTDLLADADRAGVNQIEITADGCTIAWRLDGASGGAGHDGNGPLTGTPGGRYTATTEAYLGDVYDLFPGQMGGDATYGLIGAGGTNYSLWGDDGMDGGYDGSIYGGGGGAASLVGKHGDVALLGAFGGNGGGNDIHNGAGGLDGHNLDRTGSIDGQDGLAANTGGGVISGTVTCVTKDAVAPGAPTLADYVMVGDGTAKFQFTPGAHGIDPLDSQVESSYEYQLDGGAWTAFTHGFTGSADLTGSLTGLTNMTKYSLSVRATSTAGTSAASAPVTFTPFRATAAPASVSASVGVTAIRISWTPPVDAAGVADYLAFATPVGAQSSQDTVFCGTTGTSCSVAAKAGIAYYVGVATRDALGNEGDRIFGENPTAVVPASAVSPTLPTSNGTLTTSAADGKVVAGEKVTVSGKDFLPGSTVELIVYSTPVKLGEAVVASDGTFTATVTLPATLTDGVHHLVATGVDVNGDVRNLTFEVTVSGGAAVLANTGFSALPAVGAGGLALLAGGGLLVAARRRTAA